jgi:GH24 family phage-related lysozyme (muramidase)
VSSAKADARKAQIVESYGGATDQIEADAIVSTHDAANGTTTPSTVIIQEDTQIAADEGSKTNAAGDHIAYYATTSEQTQGLVTGGIGHLMTEEESALYPEGTVIPDDVVQDWYDVDLQEAVDDAETFIGNSDVPEEVTSIITNMSFNMGLTRLSKFKGLRTALRSGDWELAADEMEWVDPTTKTAHTDWYNQVGDRAPRLIERMRNVTD